MRPDPTRPRSLRRLLPTAAALALLFVGSGATVAEAGHGDRGKRSEYGRHDGRHVDRHRARAHHDRRGHYRHDRRHDRHRYDRYRHDRHHRYDRHRRHHDYDRHRRYDHHRYDHRRYDHHRYDHHRYDHHRYDGYGHHRQHFTIPRAILHDVLHTYRPYHHGRAYHPRHRHHHDVYRFPVYGEYGVEYYPYAYCEGSFFARGVFRGGRAVFDVHLDF